MKILNYCLAIIAMFALLFLKPSPLVSGFLLTTLILSIFYRGSSKYSREVQNIGNFQLIKGEIFDFILKQGWRIKSKSDNEIIAITGINSCSWGERIEVSYLNECVHIKSKCIFPFQCDDWGKNQINVDDILNYIDRSNNDNKS